MHENDASKFHGIGKNFQDSKHYFSNSISEILEEVYRNVDKVEHKDILTLEKLLKKEYQKLDLAFYEDFSFRKIYI